MHQSAAPMLRNVKSLLASHVARRPHLRRAIGNLLWLFCDKALRLAVGLFVGVWLARYLGPEQFGLLNFATAIVSVFAVMATLGLSGVVVRDLIQRPDGASVTLGSTAALQLAGGLAAACLAVGFVWLARPDEMLARGIVAVLSASLVFRSSDVVKYWFEARVEMRHAVLVESACMLGVGLMKLVLIIVQAPLMTFVWATLAESCVVAVCLWLTYRRRGPDRFAWRVRIGRMGELLVEGAPLLLSALALVLHTRLDQIMVAQILGDASAGIYAAALRVSEAWYFVPTAIVMSVFPSILESRRSSQMEYERRLRQLYCLLVLIAVLVAVPMQLVAPRLVVAVFGPSYGEASQVLSVLVWSGLFASLSLASGRWLVAEGYGWLALLRNVVGLAVNVALNLLLIPRFGAVGAAYSTLVALAFSGYLCDALSRRTRIAFVHKTRALLFVELLTIMRRNA